MGFKLYQESMEGMKTKTQAMGRTFSAWGKKIQKGGRQIGIYGFIVSYALRQIMRVSRQLFTFFKQLFKISADFGAALEQVAFGAALLESQGLATSETLDFLASAQDLLIEYGPTLMALWEGFEAVFTAAAAAVMVQLIPSMTTLLNKLAELLAREDVIDLVARLIDGFIELALALIEVAPEILQMATFFTDLLVSAIPLIQLFAPFIPLILALGAAMFILGPIFSVIGAVMQVVGPIAAFLGGVLSHLTAIVAVGGTVVGGFTITLGTLIPIIGIVIAAIIAIYLIWKHWGEIVEWFRGVLRPLQPLFNALVGLGRAIWKVITAVANIFYQLGRIVFELIRIALTPLVDALRPVWEWLKTVHHIMSVFLAPILDKITGAVKWLTDALNTLGNILGGVGDFLGGIADALGLLCFAHVAPMVETFSESLEEATARAGDMRRALYGLRGGLRGAEFGEIGMGGGLGEGGVGGGRGPITFEQSIVIDMTGAIISSDMDLDEIANVIGDKIAEKSREGVSLL